MTTISINSLKNIQDIYPICCEIRKNITNPKLSINFKGLSFAKPLCTAFFARELRSITKEREELGLITRIRGNRDDNNGPISYLRFIGFFDFIGAQRKGTPIRSSVSYNNTYIPITRYRYLQFKPDTEIDPYTKPADLIDIEAKKISCLFTPNSQPNKTVQYIICEILRNSYEHSKSVDFFVFGQYWKHGGIELAILDDGIGIQKTLSKKYPELLTQEDAILKSLEAGASCADFDFKKNKYDNSGFGLYVLSELAKKFGCFAIVSKEKGFLQYANCTYSYDTSQYGGTMVGIRIKDIWARNYETDIDKIIEQGSVLASQGQYPISPSKQTLSYKQK